MVRFYMISKTSLDKSMGKNHERSTEYKDTAREHNLLQSGKVSLYVCTFIPFPRHLLLAINVGKVVCCLQL